VEDRSDRLTIDVRHSQALAPRLKTFDFSEILLAGGNGNGVYSGQVLRLHNFPHLVAPLRTALLRTVESHHDGRLDINLPTVANACLRIFSWMLQEGYYKLRQVPHSAVASLVATLQSSTWSAVLNHRRTFARVYLAARKDPAIAARLRSTSKSACGHINLSQLQQMTGLVLDGASVPRSFRRRIALLTGQPSNPAHGSFAGVKPGASLKSVTEALNLLALSDGEHDGFSFIPFPVTIRPTSNRGQTDNLQLSDAVKLFKYSLEWVYDRGPVLLSVLERARQLCEDFQPDAHSHDEARRRVHAATKAYVRELAPHHSWIQPDNFNLGKGNSILKWMHKTFISCASLIGINHGRRVNEVVGQGLPFGMHFGCLTSVAGSLNDFRLEIYCEKGYREYRTFPANVIVHDVVDLLERISNTLRPLGTPEKSTAATREEARRDKLFVLKSLAGLNFGIGSHDFGFRNYLHEYLEEAGVEPTLFDDTQWPFRRTFCLIYVNRFDCAEIVALSKQMGHLWLSSTIPYQRDEVERQPGTSAPEIFGRSDVDLNEILDALKPAQFQYLLDKVQAMYSGEKFGGMFPYLVHRLTKALSRNASFSSANTIRKVHTVVELLHKHGYRVNPMKHTSCMAEGPGATARLAKCYAEGSLHHENASHEKCAGCIHSLKSSPHVDDLAKEAKSARELACAATTPDFLRPRYQSASAGLAKVMELEARIATDNQRALAELLEGWSAKVSCHVE
jgi:hypothetical protein